MPVCMRCLMECGAGCEIGEQAGQAIGKALETNSTLQSLDLKCELEVGVGRARACMIRGMEGGRAHAWSRQGHVCARENRGRMVHVGVGGDVQCVMGCGGVVGVRIGSADDWGIGWQTIEGRSVGMQVPAGQGGVREAVCGCVHAMLDGIWCRLSHPGAGWAGHWEGTGVQQHAEDPESQQ